MFLIYPTGVRIVVHTANLIYIDWNNKSQGLWMQDFPYKSGVAQDSKPSPFENDLVEYLQALEVVLSFTLLVLQAFIADSLFIHPYLGKLGRDRFFLLLFLIWMPISANLDQDVFRCEWQWGGCMANISGLGEVRVNAAFFRRFDYSSALVHSGLLLQILFSNEVDFLTFQYFGSSFTSNIFK
jgi:hypothetical protein